MDFVAFLKFFKLSGANEQQKQEQEEEEEDSFFDLELFSVSAGKIQSPEQRPQTPTKLGEHINLYSDSISKRKILPIEPTSKPQSPIQFLKSAPKFPDFIFKKQRSMAKNRAPASSEERSRVLSPKITRDNSTRRIGGIFPPDPYGAPAPAPARRFSKEAVQRYLKLIKPKVLRKPTDSVGELSSTAVDSQVREKLENGLPAGIRLARRHLAKSKSASATSGLATAMAPPSNRRDDSLLQQHDGIQSAILHCKRSMNASTEKPQLTVNV